MNKTGAARVRRIKRIRKNNPQGSTPESVEPHKTHKKGRYRKMLYLRATAENRALEVFFSKRTGTSSLFTSPLSTPQRTQTCVY